MARTVVKLPKVADTAEEVVILGWLVEVGAEVTAGEPLLGVETDKVDVEVPSPVSGVLTETLVEADQEVTTGTPICVIES